MGNSCTKLTIFPANLEGNIARASARSRCLDRDWMCSKRDQTSFFRLPMGLGSCDLDINEFSDSSFRSLSRDSELRENGRIEDTRWQRYGKEVVGCHWRVGIAQFVIYWACFGLEKEWVRLLLVGQRIYYIQHREKMNNCKITVKTTYNNFKAQKH